MATSKDWYIILVSGHRSTGDGGSDIERQLTDDLAEAYTAEARARGYRADWWQRDLDKDNDPTMTKGDLNTVALGVGKAIAASSAPLVLSLDLHLNGRSSPIHVIPPDCVGLTSAYNGGAPADDTAANNTLDTVLAKGISASLAKQLNLPLLPAGRLGIPGVMSERDTRVGADFGARLAMHGGSAPSRKRAVRMVIEHAGSDQLTRIPDWASKAAKAAFDAIDAEYNNRHAAGGGTPAPTPTPDPDPANYAEPQVVPALESYLQAGTLIKTPPPVVSDGGAVDYIFAPNTYIATKATKRLQDSKLDAVSVGPDISAGQSFPAYFIHKAADGAYYLTTAWWTRVALADVKVLEPS